jgi:hypothetical protein
LELGVRSQESGEKRKKEGARRSVFTNMRCSQNISDEKLKSRYESNQVKVR